VVPDGDDAAAEEDWARMPDTKMLPARIPAQSMSFIVDFIIWFLISILNQGAGHPGVWTPGP
jgi:hypothetical protein